MIELKKKKKKTEVSCLYYEDTLVPNTSCLNLHKKKNALL